MASSAVLVHFIFHCDPLDTTVRLCKQELLYCVNANTTLILLTITWIITLLGLVVHACAIAITSANSPLYALIPNKFWQKLVRCLFAHKEIGTLTIQVLEPIGALADVVPVILKLNIAKGTPDPRVEFISQDHSSQILNILQFQNLD